MKFAGKSRLSSRFSKKRKKEKEKKKKEEKEYSWPRE